MKAQPQTGRHAQAGNQKKGIRNAEKRHTSEESCLRSKPLKNKSGQRGRELAGSQRVDSPMSDRFKHHKELHITCADCFLNIVQPSDRETLPIHPLTNQEPLTDGNKLKVSVAHMQYL